MVNTLIKTVSTKDELIDHYLIRHKVFVEEQKISLKDEYDFVEKERVVVIAYLNNLPVGTARIKLEQNAKVERVAVLKAYRTLGIGKQLMEYIIEYCISHNSQRIYLGAQEYAIPFYQKCGFTTYGECYLDANIPHYNMEKIIKTP